MKNEKINLGELYVQDWKWKSPRELGNLKNILNEAGFIMEQKCPTDRNTWVISRK